MKKNAVVSIIIPFLNSKKYLKKSIESVLRQTYKHWELILVDSGSNDGSDTLCKKYLRNNKIKLYKASMVGTSIARNVGLKYSSGDFCLFLDSDDWLPKNCLFNMVETISFSKADFCVGSICRVMPHKNIYSILSNEKYKFGECTRFPNEIIYLIAPKLFKNEIIKRNGIKFKEDVYRGEDILFCIDYLLCCDSVVTTSLCCYYYNHLFMSKHSYLYNSNSYVNEVIVAKKYQLLTKRIFLSGDVCETYNINYILNIFQNECMRLILNKNISDSELLTKLAAFRRMINELFDNRLDVFNMIHNQYLLDCFSNKTIAKARQNILLSNNRRMSFIKKIAFAIMRYFRYFFLYKLR